MFDQHLALQVNRYVYALKPVKLIPVMDAWLDKVLHEEVVFKKRLSIQYTCNVKIWFIYLLFSETIF